MKPQFGRHLVLCDTSRGDISMFKRKIPGTYSIHAEISMKDKNVNSVDKIILSKVSAVEHLIFKISPRKVIYKCKSFDCDD